jgi:putative sigma-54 modulation protein
MQVSVTFRQLEPSEALKAYVTDRLKKFKRYLDGPLEAHVVLGLEKFRHLADITINSNGHVVKGREENADMYAAIDLVIDKIDMQLRKHRGKLREVKVDRTTRTAAGAEAEETRTRAPIRRVKVEVPPLELKDAVELLENKKSAILVFTDVNTGALSILYRRTDGGLGLAEPELG